MSNGDVLNEGVAGNVDAVTTVNVKFDPQRKVLIVPAGLFGVNTEQPPNALNVSLNMHTYNFVVRVIRTSKPTVAGKKKVKPRRRQR